MTPLDRVLAQCSPSGDCLTWKGATHVDNGMPIINIKGRCTLVRRMMFQEYHGRPVAPGMVVVTCENPLCLGCDCLREVTRREMRQLAVERGAHKRPERILRMVATVRARSPYSEALIDAIRADAATSTEVSARTGVSRSHIKAIRRCDSRRPLSSPWAGLGARA